MCCYMGYYKYGLQYKGCFECLVTVDDIPTSKDVPKRNPLEKP